MNQKAERRPIQIMKNFILMPLCYLMLIGCSNEIEDKKLCQAAFTHTNITNIDVSKLTLQSLSYSEKDITFDKWYGNLFEDQSYPKFVCNYIDGDYIYLLGGEVKQLDKNTPKTLAPHILELRDATTRPVTTKDVKVIWRSQSSLGLR